MAFGTPSSYMFLVFICGQPGLNSCPYLASDPVELSLQVKKRKETTLVSISFLLFLFLVFCVLFSFERSKEGRTELFFFFFYIAPPSIIIEYRRENSSKRNCSQALFSLPFSGFDLGPMALIKVFKEAQK